MALSLRGLTGVAACVVLAAPVGTTAQDSPVFKNFHRWCVQHHPCDWAGHAAAAGVTSGLLGAATGIDSRWFAAGWSVFFIQKEIRDGLRWGWSGKDASRVAPLPRPLDAGIDLAVTAISVLWLAPALERWILGEDPRDPREPIPDREETPAGSRKSRSCPLSGCS